MPISTLVKKKKKKKWKQLKKKNKWKTVEKQWKKKVTKKLVQAWTKLVKQLTTHTKTH